MGSFNLPSGGSGDSGDSGGTEKATVTLDLSTLSVNIQSGFNATQIGWENIDWSLLSTREGWPSFTITHDADSVSVFVPISAIDPPEFLENVVDAYGNPKRIIDYAEDLFLALSGSNNDDHIRSKNFDFPDGNGDPVIVTGALMGFAGDDVLYSENIHTPMLMGGIGNDSYIIEGHLNGASDLAFVQIVERGGDDNDSLISYKNDWAFAADINGQHLILSNESQSDVVIIWDYDVADARIENFWFDFNNDGLNEHYDFNGFIQEIHKGDFWVGSLNAEALGVSDLTISSLTDSISEAVALSRGIENFREANHDTALSIARLYQAAFDREPDTGGLNFWIDEWEENQTSIGSIANSFYISEEFMLTYGGLSNDEYVNLLYQNVLNRAPDVGGFDFWTNNLDQNIETKAEVMVQFSDSLENKVNTEVQLSGLIEVTLGDWAL